MRAYRGIGPSHSGIASEQLNPALEAGLLGKYSQRKNAGRTETWRRGAGPVTVLDLTGNDVLASVVTLTLAAEPSGEAPLALRSDRALPPTLASIYWGTDGGHGHAEVDLVRGTVVQVPASALIVRAELPELPALDPGPVYADVLTVTATVGYLPQARGAATRTYHVIVPPPVAPATEASVIVPVPPFARAVRFVGPLIDAIGGFARQLTGDTDVIIAQSGGIQNLNPWALANEARRVSVVNTSGIDFDCRVIFDLRI